MTIRLSWVLIIAVAIIIIVAIVGPKTGHANARLTATEQELSSIHDALDAFRVDTGNYPSQIEALNALTNRGNSPNWHGPYLPRAVPIDPWGNPYIYVIPGKHRPMDTISLPWVRMDFLERPMTSQIGLPNKVTKKQTCNDHRNYLGSHLPAFISNHCSETMKYIRIAGGLLLSLALMINVGSLFPAYNRLRVYHNKDHYLKTIFRVEGAKYVPANGETPEAYWLTGRISGQEERFVPNFPKHFMPHNKGDIQTLYPIGTKINVLYNPSETTAIIQGETLRVLPYDSESWANDQMFPYGALLIFTLPILLVIAIYFTTRSLFTMWGWRAYSDVPR